MENYVEYKPENVVVRFEVTVTIPIFEFEREWMSKLAEENNIDISITNSGLIILMEGPKTVYECIKFIDKMGLSLDVGMIREVVEYYPDFKPEDFDDGDDEFEIIFTPEDE